MTPCPFHFSPFHRVHPQHWKGVCRRDEAAQHEGTAGVARRHADAPKNGQCRSRPGPCHGRSPAPAGRAPACCRRPHIPFSCSTRPVNRTPVACGRASAWRAAWAASASLLATCRCTASTRATTLSLSRATCLARRTCVGEGRRGEDCAGGMSCGAGGGGCCPSSDPGAHWPSFSPVAIFATTAVFSEDPGRAWGARHSRVCADAAPRNAGEGYVGQYQRSFLRGWCGSFARWPEAGPCAPFTVQRARRRRSFPR